MNKILAFTAKWCGPCQNMKMNVLGDFDPTVVIQYDIDVHDEMTKQYKINAIPTFVVLNEDGAEIDRFQGVHPASKFFEYLSE